jgi:hypothetical protein
LFLVPSFETLPRKASSQEVHQYISKRFHVIPPALFYVQQNTNGDISKRKDAERQEKFARNPETACLEIGTAR